MNPKTLLLASASPRRQQLIQLLGLPYRVEATDVDETMPPHTPPTDYVEQLSLRKASAAKERIGNAGKGCIIIGSDTIVVMDGRILGKPMDEREAFNMLTSISGRTHQVYTGITCLDADNGTIVTRHEITHVTMKKLDDERIARYIATGEPLDKAGSYAVQGIGAVLVAKIDGDYFNVVGMSVRLLSEMLEQFGITVI